MGFVFAPSFFQSQKPWEQRRLLPLQVTMADRTGFEPVVFSVTGRRVNRATPTVRLGHLYARDFLRDGGEYLASKS